MCAKRIAVIGAGNSGMGAFNACREQGFDVVVYEKTDQICGLWQYRDEEIAGIASIMRSTTLNTSKEMTPFSDFPPPKHFPNYMHNTKMAEYLTLYCERIGIKDYVRLKHEIINCEHNSDYEETGRWKLTVRALATSQVFDEVFDGVMVCTGHNNEPSMPIFVGQNAFKGSVVHSHAVKDAKGYGEKSAVVVGLGNSGGDIAVELSHVCQKVFLSTRTGSWVTHRVGPNGHPYDTVMLRRYRNTGFQLSPYTLACWLTEFSLNDRFDHKLYQLKPKNRFFFHHILVNDGLPKQIMSGAIVIKGDVSHFTEGGVVFEGEDFETPCDAVIFATGYQISYPFLAESLLPVRRSEFNLYKNVFYSHHKHPHTLAFIGLVQPIGPVLPIAELQSRWFALLMAQKVILPSEKRMQKDIKRKKVWIKKRFPHWVKHSIEVNWISYMDELANCIHVKPNLWKYFVTDPRLWWHLYFGPCAPYQYRLQGHNRWPGARDTILTVDERIRAPFNTRYSANK